MVLSIPTLTVQIFSVSSGSSSPLNSDSYVLLIVIALLVSRRLYSGFNGRVYSRGRVLRTPIIYVILTLLTVFGFGALNVELTSTLILIPAFALLGYRIGVNVTFFERNGTLYYKRSPTIMVIWLVAFIIRFAIEILIPLNTTILLVIDVLLSSTTGLLLGEAINVMRKRDQYVAQKTEGGTIV